MIFPRRVRLGVVTPDLRCSATAGPFPVDAVIGVPSYFDDNLVAHRHWIPPEA
ncbi:MAG TPA: hypothetical protein VLB67_02255 [Acidimicrobiia bacterium]|nr:hypothetical protein [Acidimicrobiia bacterium]